MLEILVLELNYNYYLYILYSKDINFYLKSKTNKNLIAKLQNLIIIYKNNFY